MESNSTVVRRRGRVPVAVSEAGEVVTTPKVVGRARKLDDSKPKVSDKVVIPKELADLATTFYDCNQKKNLYTGAADKAKKQLNKALNDRRIAGEPTTFEFTGALDGKDVALLLTLDEGTTTTLNMTKLRSLVTDEDFMKIVSATQKAIKDVAGQTVVDQVKTTKPSGEYTASVAVVK